MPWADRFSSLVYSSLEQSSGLTWGIPCSNSVRIGGLTAKNHTHVSGLGMFDARKDGLVFRLLGGVLFHQISSSFDFMA